MKSIILAAGGGSRLAPIGITTPKVLVPILNKPILQHHIDAIKDLVDETIIVIGPNHFGKLIQEYIDSHSWPINVSTVIQPEPIGTANSYQAAASHFTQVEKLLCQNGDDLYSRADLYQLAQHDYAALGQPVNDPQKWGILRPDANGNLIEMVEKPTHFIGNLANTGAFVATTEIFDLYHQIKPSSRGEYEITDTLSLLAKAHQVSVESVKDYWLPIGYPWHILDAHEKLTAQPVVGQNVQLGHNVSISGSSVIGDNVIIGDNTIIANSTIFSGANIGTDNQISHSIIGHNVEIGSDLQIKSSANGDSTVQSAIKGQMTDTQRLNFGAAIGDSVQIGNSVAIAAGCKIWPSTKIKNSSIIEQDVIG